MRVFTNRVFQLDRRTFEYPTIAVGWVAIVGLDGSWSRRVIDFLDEALL